MRRKHLLRVAVAGAVLAATAVAAWAATAVGFPKSTSTLGGEAYSDANGKIEEEVGPGTNTWAAARGEMTDKHALDSDGDGQPDLKNKSSGAATDLLEFNGLILEAEVPRWLGVVGGRMQVGSGAYQGLNFAGKIEARARGELAIWGDISNDPKVAAAEVVTSNKLQPGWYDLVVEVPGKEPQDPPRQVVVPKQGHIVKPSSDLGPGGDWIWIAAAGVVNIRQPDLDVSYRSKASGAIEIDFAITGKESADFTVEQENGQWRGILLAWDWMPQAPRLLKVFRVK